jgi:hypothetical protein
MTAMIGIAGLLLALTFQFIVGQILRAQPVSAAGGPTIVVPGGTAPFHGDPRDIDVWQPIVGIAATADGGGYWLIAGDGGVFSYGNAPFLGSMGGKAISAPIVAMAATPSGRGYWQVGADGQIYQFGDAQFLGSMAGTRLWQPIVGMAATSSGNGYWMVAADGGMFAFGDAMFRGSMGGIPLDAPVIAMTPTTSGLGYTLVAADGGTFNFGDSGFVGSGTSWFGEANDAAGIVGTADGYLLVGRDGTVVRFAEGRIPNVEASSTPGLLAVGVAEQPSRTGWWVVGSESRDRIAVWRSGGLNSSTIEAAQIAARRLGASTTIVHSGTIGISRIERNGDSIHRIAPGWQLGFSSLAFDSDEALPMIGSAVARVIERGQVVMGRRTAERVGARVGDSITILGWNGGVHTRTIGAIGSATEVGDTELTFSVADAARFGFVRPSSVRIFGFTDREAALDLVRDLLPSGFVAADPSWKPSGRDITLSTARLKELLGEFQYTSAASTSDQDSITQDPTWVANNTVRKTLPILGSYRCHKRVIDDLSGALAEVQAKGLASSIDVADTRRYSGCHTPRFIRGTKANGASPSRHAYGAAIDLNPSTNRFGQQPNFDLRVVEIFRKWGFAWGGTWVKTDGTHMEWIGGPGNDPLPG